MTSPGRFFTIRRYRCIRRNRETEFDPPCRSYNCWSQLWSGSCTTRVLLEDIGQISPRELRTDRWRSDHLSVLGADGNVYAQHGVQAPSGERGTTKKTVVNLLP